MASSTRTFCSFRLAGSLFGVNILDVKEVTTETTFTPIPGAPLEVKGYVNLRGQIHLVLDLRLLLGMEPAQVGGDSRLIIFKPATGEAFGVLIDTIGDIVQVKADQIEDASQAGRVLPEDREELHRGGDLVTGVGKLDGELMVILDARKFLKVVERATTV